MSDQLDSEIYTKHCISDDEWAVIKPPIYWLVVDKFEDMADPIQHIIKLWLDSNCEKWWYYSYKIFCFGSDTDRASFKMHLLCDQFSDEASHGELE